MYPDHNFTWYKVLWQEYFNHMCNYIISIEHNYVAMILHCTRSDLSGDYDVSMWFAFKLLLYPDQNIFNYIHHHSSLSSYPPEVLFDLSFYNFISFIFNVIADISIFQNHKKIGDSSQIQNKLFKLQATGTTRFKRNASRI